MIFVDTVRKYQEQMKFDMAIEKTVDECIRNGILEDFLKRNEYYGAAEPPVRCGESHLSGLTEPPHFVY